MQATHRERTINKTQSTQI